MKPSSCPAKYSCGSVETNHRSNNAAPQLPEAEEAAAFGTLK